MGKIVDTELNVVGQNDNGKILICSNTPNFDEPLTQIGSLVVTVDDGNFPIGSFNFEYYPGNDTINLVGVLQLDGPNNPPAASLLSSYKGGTTSFVIVTPDMVQIQTETLVVNQQGTFNGDVNVSGTTFSIVNGLIVDVIQ